MRLLRRLLEFVGRRGVRRQCRVLYVRDFVHLMLKRHLTHLALEMIPFLDNQADGRQKKALQYSPWNGSFLFWHKNHLFTFRSVQNDSRFYTKEEISVSCIGRSPKVLKDLFSDCRTKYLDIVKNKTSIFEHYNGDWKKSKAVDIRQLDTVILNDERKTALLNDVKSFLGSQAWYSVRGIPYRRGYLLYGPPGTGKSSLSLSVAGECDLDIYVLSLSSVDDDSLGELFTELPARCVILLEDIDGGYIHRAHDLARLIGNHHYHH